MKNKMEMLQQAIKEAKFFAKQHNVKLYIYEENLIDDAHVSASDYPNDIDLMTMQYKGYLVNVYIGNWDAFNEINDKWIDYDIYTDLSCEEQINESYDIRGQNVLVAITNIKFYIDKIEEDIKKKGGELTKDKHNNNKVQLGICQVSFLTDILLALKNKDYQLLRDYGYEQEIKDGFVQMWVDDLLENFCKPLIDYDKDTEIILK